MKPLFYGKGCIPREAFEANIAAARALNLPYPKAGSARLAVIGGGHSIKAHVEELRAFDGDRWIIGGAFQWAREQGIDGALFNAHPRALVKEFTWGAKEAVLWDGTDPCVFEALRGAKISAFPLDNSGDPETVDHGITTATCASVLPVKAGYKQVVFYGCDSCWPPGETTHAYEEETTLSQRILVRCNGQDFLTNPMYLIQAEYLGAVLRCAPHVFSEKSGGLLAAMVTDSEWSISEEAFEELRKAA